MTFSKTEKISFHAFMLIYLAVSFTPWGISKGGYIIGTMLSGFYLIALSFIALDYFTTKKGV